MKKGNRGAIGVVASLIVVLVAAIAAILSPQVEQLNFDPRLLWLAFSGVVVLGIGLLFVVLRRRL